MAPIEHDADHFFEALAARAPQDGARAAEGDAGARALREALLAEARTLRDAQAATAVDLSPQELASLSELKHRLMAQGVLGSPQLPANDRAGDPPPIVRLARRLLVTLIGDSWHRPVGFAAALALVSLVGLHLLLPEVAPDYAVRSGDGAKPGAIVDPDPGARAQALAQGLRAVGATVVVTPINAKETTLTINVPDTARLAGVRKALAGLGVEVPATEPPYRLSVRASP